MLAGVLNSERAIKMHIQMIRYFTKQISEKNLEQLTDNQPVCHLFAFLKQMKRK